MDAAPPVRRTRSAGQVSHVLLNNSGQERNNVQAAAPSLPAIAEGNEPPLPPSTSMTAPPQGPSQAEPSLPPASECAVFWDYENISLGSKLTNSSCTVDQLDWLCKQILPKFGRLVEMRLYSDSTKKTLHTRHRDSLERLGFSIIDCPTSDKKEMVDKKIILDACFFALPRVTKEQPTTVVIISGDGDYAHMLRRLRMVGVHTVAIGKSADLRAASLVALSLPEACGGATASPDPHEPPQPNPRAQPLHGRKQPSKAKPPSSSTRFPFWFTASSSCGWRPASQCLSLAWCAARTQPQSV